MANRGETTIKLKDVAKAAGVSQGTASNVFSKPEVVREEVREHVLAVAKELGYAGPSLKGRLLRAGKVNAIGVATAEPLSYFFDDPWARAIMAAISECCDARGAGIALVSAQNRQRAAWNIESALVDGFVLLCAEQGELLVSLTQQRELPFVALALDDAAPRTPAIAIDNATGARLAAEHLLGLGHKQFAILGIGGLTPGRALRPDEVKAGRHTTIRERADGYWQALGAAGIAPESAPFFDSDNDQAGISLGLEALFGGSSRPTALLAMSDRVAFYAMDWLIERGIRVPEDVSIIGFDGVPEGAESVPPLTTVQQPMQAIAKRAVDAILDGPVPDGPELLDLSLLVRHSTAAPATN
ncbi:MAG TPA: LacI family DNA-binding transcriptional regulator [Devosia sp.]|nr:LacI family DNA-binding transcriptional regulator [Devosia sp.]